MSDAPTQVRSDDRAALETYLQRLEEIVGEAKAMPLSASIMVNKAEVEELVAAMRDALPEEVRQARRVLRERDEVLERAEEQARRTVREAEEERDRLVSRAEVVEEAEREAERIVEDAEEHARQLRLEAEDYVDAKLANFEVVLNKTLQAVERGREKLRGTLHDVEGPDDAPEPRPEEGDAA